MLYVVTGVSVTGTPDNPQTILYSGLTTVDGVSVPATLSGTVSVRVFWNSLDVDVYITELPGSASFKIARSNIGQTGTLTVGVAIETTVTNVESTTQSYKVLDVTITGRPGAAQTINYSDLTPEDGAAFPSAFETNPVISVMYQNKDCKVEFPAIPGTTSFTVYRSNIGDQGGTMIVGLEIVGEVVAVAGNQMPLEYMLGLLGYYADDKYHDDIPLLLKVQLLNFAQYSLVDTLIEKEATHLISSIEERETNLAWSSSAFALSGLTNTIYKNADGITLLRVTGAAGTPIMRISRNDYAQLQQNQYTYSDTYPMYFEYNSTLYIYPTGMGSNFDIWYIRKPRLMTLGTTVEQNIDCELESTLHEIIVGLACKPFIEDSRKASIAYQAASLNLDQMITNTQKSDFLKFPQVLGDGVIDITGSMSARRFNILTNT